MCVVLWGCESIVNDKGRDATPRRSRSELRHRGMRGLRAENGEGKKSRSRIVWGGMQV